MQTSTRLLYADNASTLLPKSKSVINSIEAILTEPFSLSGLDSQGGRICSSSMDECRVNIGRLAGIEGSYRVVLNSGATFSLNECIQGLLVKGDHVITTVLEHNSVLRPLEKLKTDGIITYECLNARERQIEGFEQALMRKKTKLVVFHSCSNTQGSLLDIILLGLLAKKYGALVLIDGSQSLGYQELNLDSSFCDFFVFSGHKSIGAYSGTGGYIILNKTIRPIPLTYGGTGVKSDSLIQPNILPYKYESGTLNELGMISLAAAVKERLVQDIKVRVCHLQTLRDGLIDGLTEISNIKIYNKKEKGLPIILINHCKYIPNEFSFKLKGEYGITTRPGLQCAPLAHMYTGTYPAGALRISLSDHNSMEDIEYICDSIRKM